MNDNLSTQFDHVQHAVGFDKWAKAERQRLYEEHTVSPGHVSFADDREAGRRAAQLHAARGMLVEAASYGFYTGSQRNGGLDMPLRENLPDHYHHLVDEYEAQR